MSPHLKALFSYLLVSRPLVSSNDPVVLLNIMSNFSNVYLELLTLFHSKVKNTRVSHALKYLLPIVSLLSLACCTH